MIAPDSASYPLLGIARAFGVDYGEVLALAWASDRRNRLSAREILAAWDGAAERMGLDRYGRLSEAVRVACEEGRLRLGGV